MTADDEQRMDDEQQTANTMAKTNFENLRVYGLAEQVADEIWQLVLQWDNFVRHRWQADGACC